MRFSRLTKLMFVAIQLMMVSGCRESNKIPEFIEIEFISSNKGLFLRGESCADSLHFIGEGLRGGTSEGPRFISISGKGKIRRRSNLIEVESTKVVVNGTPLTDATGSYILDADGSLVRGFIRTFD